MNNAEITAGILSLFTKAQHQRVKSEVKNVSFISFVKGRDGDSIRVVANNKKDEFTFKIETSPEEITEKDYTMIINNLKDFYGEGSTTAL